MTLPGLPPVPTTRLAAVSTTETMGTAPADGTTSATGSTDAANRAFSTSILISAVRCTLTYVVFPWMLPAIGIAGGVGPGVGLAIGIIAIGFNFASIRRFWVSDHHWKIPITVLNSCVIVMLSVLVVLDLQDLLG